MARFFNKIILLFLVFGNSYCYAQSKVFSDAGLWNTLNIKHKLNEKFALSLTEEFRLKENYSQVNLTYTDIGLEYSPKNFIKTSVVYRCIQKFKYDNPISFRNRLMWDIAVKKEMGKWTVAYRHRLQGEVKDLLTSKHGYFKEWFSRSKFTVKYEYNKRLVPYAAVELRCQLEDSRSPEYNYGFHRSRFQLGFDYKISGKQDVGLYYLIQKEYNIANRTNLYILGIEYSIDL